MSVGSEEPLVIWWEVAFKKATSKKGLRFHSDMNIIHEQLGILMILVLDNRNIDYESSQMQYR